MTVARHCRDIDLTSVRDALQAALAGVEFYGQPMRVCEPDAINPPCAIVGTFTVIFDDGEYDGLTTATCSVRLIVPMPSVRTAQQDLDEILAVGLDALQRAQTLGNTVITMRPVRATPVMTTRGNQELPSYDLETLVLL